ncbi:ImmA/IrrE family metallo-endopeptidase [Clostridium perfringens]|uniref:ImmA/IrrE family metallo-endopeptidase n=2 Tax=Clostridium perfringens TaxID=1502 RepID=A0AAP6WS62_CLOPF|nr:ImmA/IrrE family metallo-endopeptidase [Clostridium perfringens]NGU31787.1 ImmA/IrrE family metallo-endopeptidase [Clostridium perfringens]WEV08598.1 ImmA/IrrE family metallo-endopeptidase [Clostridium perfringens B]
MAYNKKEYKSKSQEEKRKEIDLLVKQANEKIDKVFSSPNDLKEYLSFMAKFHNYSYKNSILIEKQFRGAVAVGSFAFWKEKGYSVNKGEKGIKILVPTKLGDRFIAEDGTIKLISKASEKEKQLIKSGDLETLEGAIKFKQGYVFDVSQTNIPASELPKIFPNKWLEGDVKNYKAFYKSLEDVASKIGVKIIEPKSELGLVKGISYTSTKEVALNPRNSQLQNVKTLIHELAHAKLHTVETRDNYTKAEKEFQAEMIALSVSSYFGINTEEYSLRYLSEWAKNATFKDKEKLLKEVSTTVKEYVEIMEGSLNAERELTKENELVNSLSDENIKKESELNLEMEGEMDFENEKFIEIKDENIKDFLRTDKVIIYEVSKSELEELVDNNKSFIWFKAEKGSEVNSDIFTSENHVIAVKEKGVYQDVYIRKNYDLENLIYVDDKKNLYKIKSNENEFNLGIEKGLVKEELKVKGIKNELIEKYFNDLGLSQEGKEKWITDYFNENNIQDKVRDNLVKQEEFLEVLENKFYIDYDIEMLKDQIECFGKGEASDYYGNYYDNDLSEEDKKLNKETEKRMATEFNELNESLKKKEIELSNFDKQLNEFIETVEKNIDKFEKAFNIEYNSKSEIEINANELLNIDIEKMEVLKDRIDKENRLGRDQSKDCRIDYGILKTFSERFNEKVEVLDNLGINHAGIEKVDKEEIVKYSEKAKFPEVGEVKILKSESMHFKENQILTFNEANKLFEREEAHIRDLKREYESKGEYYPYEKVKGEVKINDNVDFEFRYDIGDGEFYNLADLLERELSNTNHQYAVKDFLIEKGVRENDKEEKVINDIVSNLNYEKEEELER